jgi:hypothetical protein
MDPTALGPLLGLVVGIAGGTAVVLGVTSLVLVRGRRRLEGELRASRSELALLRERLDALTATLERSAGPATTGARPEYLITTVPQHPKPATSGVAATADELARRVEPPPGDAPTGRGFATVVLTDTVVRAASLSHGVRRALSPQNRNRIRFEMAREVKRSRRQRRRDLKEAKRHLRRSSDLSTPRVTDPAVGDAA